MRYSIIHHDVREKFNLTICEYLVCDSIHQLGHYAPCTKTNKEIGDFIGFGDWAVGNAKKSLIAKDLIKQVENGILTTSIWHTAVTYASTVKITEHRENHGKTVKITDTLYIKNINTNSEEKKEKDSSVIEIPIDQDGVPTESRAERKKADVSYKEVFKAFKQKYPRNWDLNRTQIQAAKNLLEERGLPQIRGALKFHSENSDHEFCPGITSPYDLDSKWSKLAAFKRKYG